MISRMLYLFTSFALVVPALAQVPQVRISPYAEVKQRVGLTDISVVHHRPGVKGREIWGKLLPFNEIWRAGANEPTVITWSDTLTVAGTKLAPGSYRFVVIPRASGTWTAVFNSEVKNWGTVYDSTYDVARIPVTPVAAPHEEWMSFTFSDLSGGGATLVLRWEKVAISLPFQVNTAAKFATLARNASGTLLGTLMAQARYLLENDGSLADATKIADQANAMEEGVGTLRLKAEILAKQGKYADAVKTAEKAIQVGKSRNPNFNTTMLDGFIKDWKEKAGTKK